MSKILFRAALKSYSVELCSNKRIDLNCLSSINPLFYSVTFHDHVSAIYDNLPENNNAIKLAIDLVKRSHNVLLHLPCRYFSEDVVFNILTVAKENGIHNILALQGEYVESKQTSDFKYAIDLIRFIKTKFPNTFRIGVTGYPNNSDDLIYLKQKIDFGVDFIITQAIFDMESFHKFYQKCRAANISIPIIPGIYIINSYNELKSMTKFCKIAIPEYVLNAIESIKDNDTAVINYGIQHATQLITNLFTNSNYPIENIHIFSLNNIEAIQSICRNVEMFK